jgi:predicted regulator of Ras-like GTPase activity (Roadblock/LC7/MglB family)
VPRKLDPRILSEYKPKATMASPFRESIVKLLDSIDGGVACVLMGFDGITVDTYSRPDVDPKADDSPDIQTLSMEFAHLIAQARRTLDSVDAGTLEEFTLRTDKLTLVVRLLTPEYFLACAILPAASLGRARYLMRLTAPGLRADL